MPRRPRVLERALLILMLCGGGRDARAAEAPRDDQARVLLVEARADIALGTFEGRRAALTRLQRARLLAPDDAEIALELARLETRMGFLREARRDFESVARQRPDDPEARRGLAAVWRRDYLKYLDRKSLALAIEHLQAVVRVKPGDTDAWLNLVPLLVEQGALPAALGAAEHASASAPGRSDAMLAVAHTGYRVGQVERADSLFRLAIPRLVPSARRWYDDIAPVATMQDTMGLGTLSEAQRAEFRRRFWATNDPDLTTPENEAQLEYWSRVTQAYFLYYDSRRREWDQRGEVYVRYGPPRFAIYNPVGDPLSLRIQDGLTTRVDPLFPMNVLVWVYPELGMTVTLEDRVLSEYYQAPIALDRDTGPRPSPDSLARLDGAYASSGGRGVFPLRPPGRHPLPIEGVVARFEGSAGPRVIGLMATEGVPAESSLATWVVLDSARREVARMSRTLSPSACDPIHLRAADFSSELPPGNYLVGLGVQDGRGGRGSVRGEVRLEQPVPRLALSDLVVSCGGADVQPGGPDQPPAVRLTANPGGVVLASEPLTLYFEAYHLRPGPEGLSQLEFEYVVRSAERDRRSLFQRIVSPRTAIPEISATRQEDQPGTLRRQFVSVPVQSLPAGHYRVEVTVRDRVSGQSVTREASFERR